MIDAKIPEPTEIEYNIKCRVEIKEIHVQDELPIQGKISFTRDAVFLIPEMNDMGVQFLKAWLPDTASEHFEIAMFLSTPVFSPCRGAIKRGDDRMPKHYIYVMSKGVEEDILRLKKAGALKKAFSINVKVYPESQDSIAEMAHDSTQSADVIDTRRVPGMH